MIIARLPMGTKDVTSILRYKYKSTEFEKDWFSFLTLSNVHIPTKCACARQTKVGVIKIRTRCARTPSSHPPVKISGSAPADGWTDRQADSYNTI